MTFLSIRRKSFCLAIILSLALTGCGGSSDSGLSPGGFRGFESLGAGFGSNGGPTNPGPGTGVPNPFGPGGGGIPSNSPPTSLIVEGNEPVALGIGQTIPLQISVTLLDGTVVTLPAVTPQAVGGTFGGVAFTFESRNPSVAMVGANATVTGVSRGATIVDVTATSGGQTLAVEVPINVDASLSFLYLANPTPNGGGGWITVLGLPANGIPTVIQDRVPNTGRPLTIGASPDGQFVYAVNVSTDDITPYTVTEGTGELTTNGENIPAGNSPRGLVFTPDQRFAYAGNFNGNILGYDVLLNGRLEAMPGTPIDSQASFVGPVINPAGDHIYSVNDGTDSIGIFSIDMVTGALSFIENVPAGNRPFDIAFHAVLPFAYTANGNSDDISGYEVDDGSLIPLGVTPALNGPGDVATHPTLPFLYATGGGLISSYEIDSGGALTFIESEALGPEAGTIIIEPSGTYMYIPVGGSRYDLPFYRLETDGRITPIDIFDDPSIDNGFSRDGVSVGNPLARALKAIWPPL